MNKLSIQLFKMLFALTLAFAASLTVSSAAAQEARVTLDVKDVTLEQVMSQIEEQTSYLFVYNKDIDLQRMISLNVEAKPLSAVLNEALKGSSIEYQLSGTNIILTKSVSTPAESAPKHLTGQVLDENGAPVLGATIIVVGTTIGTSTDTDGRYTLTIPASEADPQLGVNYLGYEPMTIAVGTRTTIDIELVEDTVDVAAVVVTALGIKRSEKALAYNVQTVDADDLVENKDANFINSLNGKVAGLVVNASSSGVGGASQVVMRGQKSISQSSNALYVIDGVPMLSVAMAASTEFGSQGTTDPIADINPEDIESISVLSGAAAAALYGSDAANGAIVVNTKRGQAGKLSVTLSSSTEISTPFVLPEFQNRYGTGDYNSSERVLHKSWGERLNAANTYGFDPAQDYYQTGVTNSQNVSLSTGNEKNQTYLSAANIYSEGIVPNNQYERYNFTIRNTSSFLDDKMTLNLGANYILQKDRNMTNQGEYNNPIVGAYLFPRGNDWSDIEMFERWDPVRNLYTQYWPSGDGGKSIQNPYWVNYRNLRENVKNRYMFNASLSYDILDWLNVSGRVFIDNSNNKYTEKFYASTYLQLAGNSQNGLYGVTESTERQVYADALLNINKSFGDDFTLQANIGASISDMQYDAMKVRGAIPDGLMSDEAPGIANVFSIQNLSNTAERFQDGYREQTQSIFASAEIGYKGTYYLTLTGRNDWPSQLAGPHSKTKSFFYPSVGGSVVLSQIIPEMPKNLSYVKLRASYASVGVAFARYLANPKYEWNQSGLRWSTQTAFPIYNLSPERTYSYEAGLTMRFLKKFNLDLTYYHAETNDQTFTPNISTGSGSSIFYVQSGSILNSGIEAALSYSNKWGKFGWTSSYTFSTNKNEILSLADNVTNPITGEVFSLPNLDIKGLGQAHFILKEGGTMGDLYSLVDLRRDSDGQIYVDEAGNIATEAIQDPDKYIKLGSVLPDANMSWRNDFSYGNFNLGFMITARLGGIVFSHTQGILDSFGVSEASAAARDAGGVMINGGDMIDPNHYYTVVASGDIVPQLYTYSATNVRLQELSFGYTIPRAKLGNVCDMTISLVGRNLLMIYNKAPFDPEAIATTGNFYQGIDNFMLPSMRNIGFNLRLKF